MNDNGIIGQQIVYDAMRQRDDLMPILTRLFQRRDVSLGLEILAGAVVPLIHMRDAVRKAGYKIGTNNPQITEILRRGPSELAMEFAHRISNRQDNGASAWELLSALGGLANSMRDKITLSDARAAEPPPEPKQTEPLRVVIVSQPTTVAVQTVVRDQDQEIQKTVTTTTAAPA